MSKSNPTTRPDAPNYEVVGNMIHRYEPMTIAEAFGVLSERKEPLCGFRDADFQPWTHGNLYYVHPGSAEPFRTKSEKFRQCARITAEDPRKVPEGVPELPEPWLAYVGPGPLNPSQRTHEEVHDLWGLRISDINPKWASDCEGMAKGWHYAIDVRTAFAREHFPEYVQALGYPIEEAKRWEIGDKVCAIGTELIGEVTATTTDCSIITFPDGSCASFSHSMLEAAPERIQLTDTQLLDKLAETEYTLPDGRQFWEVFTDRGSPQMTVREAIAAWGGEE